MAYHTKMASIKQYCVLALMLCFYIISGYAQTRATYVFASAAAEDKFNQLTNHLRCLVCQNQSLADSNAELAVDLRQQIYDMVNQNAPNEAIINFMVSRYGDFILYEPPVRADTYLLWFGPFLALLMGFLILVYVIRRRQPSH